MICGADFGRQAAGAPAFVDDDGPMRFGDRLQNRLHVERPQRPQVDDFARRRRVAAKCLAAGSRHFPSDPP